LDTHLFTIRPKSTACATSVVAVAGGVRVRTEPLLAFAGTRDVGHASVIGNEALLFDELKGSSGGAAMTASRRTCSAVEDVLDAQVYIVSLCPPCDFNSIGQGGQGPVRPARSTILGNVLVEALGEIGDAFDVVPAEATGEIIIFEVSVGKGGGVVVHDAVA